MEEEEEKVATDRREEFEEKLDAARREARRWQQRYRELQIILERQQVADHELYVAQAQSAQSAKRMLQLAYCEQVELGQELVALDDDLVSVVSTLASSLAGILDRALDRTSADQPDSAAQHSDAAGADLEAPEEEHRRPAEEADAQPAGSTLDAEACSSAASTHDAPAAEEAQSGQEEGENEGSACEPPQPVRGGPDGGSALAAGGGGSALAAWDGGSALAAGKGGSALAAAGGGSALAAEDAGPSIRLQVDSVHLVPGGLPAGASQLLLALDVLGAEGLRAPLERTASHGAYSARIDVPVSLQPGSRARDRVAHALADDDPRASDVRLSLFFSVGESAAAEACAAVLNLEALLESRREPWAGQLPLLDAEGRELGSVRVRVDGWAALHAIDCALAEHGGSALAMLEAERAALRAAAAADGEDSGEGERGRRPSHASSLREQPLSPLAEEGSDAGAAPLSRSQSGADERTQAAARQPAPGAGAEGPAGSGTGDRPAPPGAPGELLSPELQRLRASVPEAEQDAEWACIDLAHESARVGTERVVATASPAEVGSPAGQRRALPPQLAPHMRPACLPADRLQTRACAELPTGRRSSRPQPRPSPSFAAPRALPICSRSPAPPTKPGCDSRAGLERTRGPRPDPQTRPAVALRLPEQHRLAADVAAPLVERLFARAVLACSVAVQLGGGAVANVLGQEQGAGEAGRARPEA